MNTLCTHNNNILQLTFQSPGKKKVEAKFDGGMITSDAGSLLLREIYRKYGILESFSQCFTDYRDCRYIDHTVKELVSQRVYAISAGYEDVNDHDRLRNDSLLATVCGKEDPEGKGSRRDDFFTATMTATVSCLCTSFAGVIFYVRS